jgi:hypothetical protein
MTDRPSGRQPGHAEHDPFLIARLAGDDLDPGARLQAEARVAACDACARLLADLRAIDASLAADLPIPARPLDFRLRQDQLPRSRPGPLARLRGLFRSPSPWLTPIASAAMVLGLALLLASGTVQLFTAVPFGASAGAAAPSPREALAPFGELKASESAAIPASPATESAIPVAAPADSASASASTGDRGVLSGGPLPTASPGAPGAGTGDTRDGAGTPMVSGYRPPVPQPAPPNLALGGIGLLLAIAGGLGLLARTRLGRRHSGSPNR